MNRIFKALLASMLTLISVSGSFAQVSVTATSGTLSGSYTSLNAAFAAINAGTHHGAINILITGNTTEPTPPTPLVNNTQSPAGYSSIMIKPTGGSWTIHSAAIPYGTKGIIELKGAQHVTIDGDPGHTGTPSLTFKLAKTTNQSVAVIGMGQDTTTLRNGAAYDTVRSCNIIGGRDSVNAGGANYGIIFNLAINCSYNAFIGNTFSRCTNALYMSGGLGNNSNTLIRGNRFLGSTPDTSNNNCIYISLFNTNNSTSTGIIDSNDFTATGTGAFAGINLRYARGSTIISDNFFHDIDGPSVKAITYLGMLNVLTGSQTSYAPLQCYSNKWINSVVGGSGGSHFLKVYGDAKCLWNVHHNLMDEINGTGGLMGLIMSNNYTNLDTFYCHDNIVTNLTQHAGSITAAQIFSGDFYRNKISGLACTDSGGCSWGMDVWGGNILNNTICDLKSFTRAPVNLRNSSVGIQIQGNPEVHSNTIALNTQNVAGSSPTAISAAIFVYSGGGSIKDNILYNKQSSSNSYGLYGYDNAFQSTVDYNAYYIPNGYISKTSTTPYTTLAGWQAATGGADLHSVAGPIPFVSNTNVHIDTQDVYANTVFRVGTYIDSLDIDAQVRHNPPCIGADEFTGITVLSDSVWPGDADASRLVEISDLLPIGLGYDSAGPVRTITGIVWQADAAADWADSFAIYAPAVNFKHADCNGDGIINAVDTTAIIANLSLTHAKTADGPDPWRSGTPGLKISFSQDTVHTGDTLVTSFIIGDSLLPAGNILGVAFTYHYDPIIIDSTAVSFSFVPSWLAGTTDAISLSRNDFSTGSIKAAITRIDHTHRSGYGIIANMTSRINTDNINGKDLAYYTNHGYISDITAIDAAGNRISLNAGIDSNYVAYELTGIHDVDATAISIYPNPAKDKIKIVSASDMQLISIYDIPGQLLSQTVSNKQAETIAVSDLANGVYIVSVITRTDRRELKLIISR